jgi:uncharacterized membrane protein
MSCLIGSWADPAAGGARGKRLLFGIRLQPFATAWIARTRLASSPVVFYAGLFVCIDIAYNVFERQVLPCLVWNRDETRRRTETRPLLSRRATVRSPFCRGAAQLTVAAECAQTGAHLTSTDVARAR